MKGVLAAIISNKNTLLIRIFHLVEIKIPYLFVLVCAHRELLENLRTLLEKPFYLSIYLYMNTRLNTHTSRSNRSSNHMKCEHERDS